jgi:serine/threonine protein phosphatase PrpC
MERVLLASDHLDPLSVASETLAPGLVFALTAGEGPSRNPKQQKNEDSLAVLSLPGAQAGVVADSHWGAFAGEALARAAASALAAQLPRTHQELARLLLGLDLEFRRERPKDDRSETTLLAAVVRGSEAIWASIADSHIYAVSARGAERLNEDRPMFAGGTPPLVVFADRVGEDTVVDSGEWTLRDGEVLLLASDGIAPEDSGLEASDLAAELGGEGDLLGRVRRLIDRARRPPGGRDNIALVAIEPASPRSR